MAFPIIAIGELAIRVVNEVLDHREARKVPPEASEKIEEAIKADPVLKNQLNVEPPWQSRVVIGNVVAALSPFVGYFIGRTISADDQLYWTVGIWMLMQGAGVGLSLYGRLKSGLKPLFSKG